MIIRVVLMLNQHNRFFTPSPFVQMNDAPSRVKEILVMVIQEK